MAVVIGASVLVGAGAQRTIHDFDFVPLVPAVESVDEETEPAPAPDPAAPQPRPPALPPSGPERPGRVVIVEQGPDETDPPESDPPETEAPRTEPPALRSPNDPPR